MKITTIPGETYVVTTSVPLIVSALLDDGSTLTLHTLSEPGQCLLVAPTSALIISDERALVTRTFNRAACGTTSGGGIRLTWEEKQQTRNDGNDNLNAHGFGITAAFSGWLEQVSVRARLAGTLNRVPLWIKTWRVLGGKWQYAGTSRNSVIQTLGENGAWLLPPLWLQAGEPVLFTFHEERSIPSASWGDFGLAGLRVRAVPHEALTGCIRSPSNPPVMYDYLPDGSLSFRCVSGAQAAGMPLAPLAAILSHASDAVAHLKQEEHVALAELLAFKDDIINGLARLPPIDPVPPS